MEGVVVSARKEGSTIRISVISDAQGQFSFPATKLDPGSYKISIRAAGYDLDESSTAEVAANKTTTADLKLRKTRDLAAQLTNADWMSSLPDQPARRATRRDRDRAQRDQRQEEVDPVREHDRER